MTMYLIRNAIFTDFSIFCWYSSIFKGKISSMKNGGAFMEQSSTIHEDKGGKIQSSSLIRRGILLVVSGSLLGKTGILNVENFMIGRDSNTDLQIPDNKVSGQHCRISSGRDGFLLEDMDSTNGTYINRKRIKKPALLNYGDRIVLGNTILRFFLEEEI